MVKDNRKTVANNNSMAIYVKKLNDLLKSKGSNLRVRDSKATAIQLVDSEGNVLITDYTLKERFNNQNKNFQLTEEILSNDLKTLLVKANNDKNQNLIKEEGKSKVDKEKLLNIFANKVNLHPYFFNVKDDEDDEDILNIELDYTHSFSEPIILFSCDYSDLPNDYNQIDFGQTQKSVLNEIENQIYHYFNDADGNVPETVDYPLENSFIKLNMSIQIEYDKVNVCLYKGEEDYHSASADLPDFTKYKTFDECVDAVKSIADDLKGF